MATPLSNLSPCSPWAHGCSLGQLEFLLYGDMIFPWGKKSLNCSLGQLKFLPKKKGNFLTKQ